MSIETNQIVPAQAAAITAIEESHFADVKAIAISPSKLTKAMSAFANADGGELFIGVSESNTSRSWAGFANVESANGHLQAFEATFPLDQYITYEFLECAGGDYPGLVLHVEIRRTPDIKLASDGKAYVRRGAQSLPGNLERLQYEKGVASFEVQTVDAPLTFVTDSFTITDFMIEVIPDSEAEPWLRKQLLIRDDRPTVAASLLFSDEPQAVLPKQSAIKIYRYATTDDEGTRASLQGQPRTIEGNLYQQIEVAVRTTRETIEGMRVMDVSGDGLTEIEYPVETLHEITTNAVLHRDYSIADDIHVRIFDNRIEVESPGRLPGHVTQDNILDERFSRNGQLVRWINKFPDPPNKDVGEGLRTAFDAMRALQLRPPEIADRDYSVLVTIKHERLASPEEMILEFLQDHSEIANRHVRDLTGIGSENKVKGIFQAMMRAKAIERIPGRSLAQTAYRLPAPTDSDV